MDHTGVGQSEKKIPAIMVDSRQQTGKHDLKDKYFSDHNIDTVHSKLYVGDYALISNMTICVDTKRSIDEIAGNLTHDHERFARECDKAFEHGIKLFILVENTEGIKIIDDVKRWSNPRYQIWKRRKEGRAPTSAATLMRIMRTFEEHHHCKFYFCSPESSGRAIVYLLTGQDLGE